MYSLPGSSVKLRANLVVTRNMVTITWLNRNMDVYESLTEQTSFTPSHQFIFIYKSDLKSIYLNIEELKVNWIYSLIFITPRLLEVNNFT